MKDPGQTPGISFLDEGAPLSRDCATPTRGAIAKLSMLFREFSLPGVLAANALTSATSHGPTNVQISP